MSHPLTPLLNPASIAVVGASEREETPGRETIDNLLNGGFRGSLYAINPGYEQVRGVPCFPELAALPETVEQVLLVVGDTHVESILEQVIAHGARSAVIISSLANDGSDTPLMKRIQARARRAGLLLMGGSSMGYYNFEQSVWACAFDTRDNHEASGGISLITHSGSGLSGLIDCDERLDCNLAISTGQELLVSLDQYMDYALEQDSTRVIGLFMETARNPDGLRAALGKARDRKIPVVALKVGRTELSARLAVSHSGALAGEDSAYQALFDHYGVTRVKDLDEFSTALIMFNQPHPVASGGLVTLHDSGGERQLLIDLAEELDVPLARLSDETIGMLEARLDPGLPAVNPLDAWSAGGSDAHSIMEDCLAAMMRDPAAAMGAVVHDRAPYSRIYSSYHDYLRQGHEASGKPVFLVANRQGTGSDPAVTRITREGFPVLDGLRPFLVGARSLMAYRDFLAQAQGLEAPVNDIMVAEWRSRLGSPEPCDEALALRLLSDFEVPACAAVSASNLEDLEKAADRLEFPLVLKTAEHGIVHKSDVGGVVLGIPGRAELVAAYQDISGRIGPNVVVMEQVRSPGIEMVLGMSRDAQFGPVVMIGFGGLDIEVRRDVGFLLPPFDAATARRAVDRLPGRRLMDEHRGRGPLALDAFCAAAARFSAMASSLGDLLEEVDVNPVIVHESGCVAVDAYIRVSPDQAEAIPRPSRSGCRSQSPIMTIQR